MSYLDLSQNYSFSDYLDLDNPVTEIFDILGYSLKFSALELPKEKNNIPHLPDLEQQGIERTLSLVELINETARREIIIAPILFNIVKILNGKLYFEYNVNVNNYLKGRVDYYIKSKNNFIVVEAKNEDLSKGFLQLGVELIAFSNLYPNNFIYGVVTTGQIWQFSILDTVNKYIIQDTNFYTIPSNLNEILETILGILLL